MGKVKVPGGGVEQAAKLLQSLSSAEREKILEDMKTKDPQLAAQVEKYLISFSDLVYMTPKMLQDFLKKIKLSQLGLALRGTPPEIHQFFLTNMSSGMAREVEEQLKGKPRPLREVTEAQDQILAVAREMAKKGQIVLSSQSRDKLV